jgi:hypothetical protein
VTSLANRIRSGDRAALVDAVEFPYVSTIAALVDRIRTLTDELDTLYRLTREQINEADARAERAEAENARLTTQVAELRGLMRATEAMYDGMNRAAGAEREDNARLTAALTAAAAPRPEAGTPTPPPEVRPE